MLNSTLETVSNYEGRVSSFHNWSIGSEVDGASFARIEFLKALSSQNPKKHFRILDVGCGTGRDILEFSSAGHFTAGIEPCVGFFEMASCLMKNTHDTRIYSFYNGDICDSSLIKQIYDNEERFDGAFCLASLFHIPTSQLHIALENIKKLLRPDGVLFSSFPVHKHFAASTNLSTMGEGSQLPDGRWCTELTTSAHKELLALHGFIALPDNDSEIGFTLRIYNGEWTCIVSKLIVPI